MSEQDKLISVTIDELSAPPPVEPVDIKSITGMIPTISSVPTHVPKKLVEQVLIYSYGGTFRLYVYDTVGNAWRYATLT